VEYDLVFARKLLPSHMEPANQTVVARAFDESARLLNN
jgi:hypothetical protein